MLREAIVDVHTSKRSVSFLDQFMKELTNDKKDKRYSECVAGYKLWAGKKELVCSGCSTADWTSGDLEVRVNPELGLRINGSEHVIKLYFKQVPLSKLRVDSVLHLLKTTLPAKQRTAVPGILDVPNAKLHTPTVVQDDIGALLAGEAAAFSSMWKRV